MLWGTKEGPAGQHNFKRAGGGSENLVQAAIQVILMEQVSLLFGKNKGAPNPQLVPPAL